MHVPPHLLPSGLCSNITFLVKLSFVTLFNHSFHLQSTTSSLPSCSVLYFFQSTGIYHLLAYCTIMHILVMFTVAPPLWDASSVSKGPGLFYALCVPSPEHGVWSMGHAQEILVE